MGCLFAVGLGANGVINDLAGFKLTTSYSIDRCSPTFFGLSGVISYKDDTKSGSAIHTVPGCGSLMMSLIQLS